MTPVIVADIASYAIAIAVSAVVTITVLGVFVWAAIEDGRDEKARRRRRRPTS